MTSAALAAAVVLTAQAVPSAQATSKTATLKVNANVVANCILTTTDLVFGNYDPVSAHASSPLDSTASITLTCTQGTVAAVGVGDGNNYSSGRRMAASGGSEFLEYGIYADAARSLVWRTAGAIGRMSFSAAPSTAPRTVPVYGRVPAGQNVSVGSYADDVVVTVTY
jgi:spore coat protein U-like protein